MLTCSPMRSGRCKSAPQSPTLVFVRLACEEWFWHIKWLDGKNPRNCMVVRGMKFLHVIIGLAALAVASCGKEGVRDGRVGNLPLPFSTNTPGDHVLDPAWVGKSIRTVQIGFFTNNLASFGADKLQFDLLSVGDPSRPSRIGPFLIGTKAGRATDGWSMANSHSYRPVLPTDMAIQECSRFSGLRKLLGEPDWVDGPPLYMGWRLFTIAPSNSIETLLVLSMAGRNSPDDVFESLAISRGTARQTN